MRLQKDVSTLPAFARRLANERAHRKLNQTQMAELLETTQSQYSKWERGEVIPEATNAERIAAALAWKLDAVFFRSLVRKKGPPGQSPAEPKRRRAAG